MKNLISACVVLMLLTLSGCQVIEDIFSAGVYTGVFMVVMVIAIIVFLIIKMGRRG